MTQNTEKSTPSSSFDNSTQSNIKEQLQRPYRFSPDTTIHTNRGTYKILAPLGQGGFADVYHCRETDLGREFAIKVLIKEGADLKEEAKIVAQLEHPNIIQIHAFAELIDDNTPVIIYNFIKGPTLYERMGQGKLPLDTHTLKIIQQIGDALASAHKIGVHHRDIKPSNIIIDENGKAYLTDFGLASVKSAPEGESLFTDLMRARLGGTIPYMPPELLRDESRTANVQTDIYSLGVVVYEMLTGQLPYPGRDVQLITNIIDEKIPPTPPSRINPNLPPGLNGVLEKALTFDPNDRYQTVDSFINALKPVTKEFAERTTYYQRAIEHIENGRWQEAKILLTSSLPQEYEDVAIRLEQVEQKLRIQNLVNKTKTQIQNNEFDKALATLDTLRNIDPNYEVLETLHQKAIDGRTQQEQRSLEEQYQQAVSQLNKGKHQAALDTITIIKKKKPDYPDPDNVEGKASEVVQEQNELQALLNQGREYVRSEEWENARDIFTELSQRKPNYQDVNQQLALAQHFYELEKLREQARESHKEGKFAESIDLLDLLKNKNERYKVADIAGERQKYVSALVAHCEEAIAAEQFDVALTAISQLKERQPDLPQLEQLEEQAKDGRHSQQTLAELTTAYAEAEQKIQQTQFLTALDQWQDIQKKATKNDIPFTDSRRIENQAKQGVYSQALAAVNNKQPDKALSLLNALHKRYADFNDYGHVEQNATTQIKRRRQRLIGAIVGVILLVVAFFIGRANINNGSNDPEVVADTAATQTAVALAAIPTSTSTSTPTSTTTATNEPTPTATTTVEPTSTSTTEPSNTPRPSATPANIATARFSSSIFAELDETSEELTFIDPGESVTILDNRGSWIRVINDDGIEGWVAANRFDITIGLPTETPTATNTPAPSNTPGELTAVTTDSASLFAGPDTNYTQQKFINPGSTVTVLGRSANESWLFVRTSVDDTGWVAISLLDYDGDITELPITQEIMTPVSGNGGGDGGGNGGVLNGLTFDFWDLPGAATCSGSSWTMPLFMEGHGGDGRYTYYINDQQVAGPLNGSYTYDHTGSGVSNVRITGRVTSGDGQSTETILFASAPDC